MKSIFIVIIFVLGILMTTSCRSTSQSCGLAENEQKVQTNKSATQLNSKIYTL